MVSNKLGSLELEWPQISFKEQLDVILATAHVLLAK